MKCSRREFLKKSAILTASLMLPFFPFESRAVSVDPTSIISLINLSCVKCSLNGLCIKVKRGKVKVAPKISYWVPDGFIETGAAFEIGKSASALSFASDVFKPIVDLLSSIIPEGSKTQGELRGHEVYMKLYPHFFGYPPVVADTLRDVIATVASKNPACLCSIVGSIGKSLIDPTGTVSKIDEYSNEYLEKVESLKRFKGRWDEILNQYTSVLPDTPVFLSEIVFFLWILEMIHPDKYAAEILYQEVINNLAKLNTASALFLCPYGIQKLAKHLPSNIDPSFICVGHWGFGYPRTGVVKHDDPIVAGLLSIARFHHLFSRTFPIINTRFDFSNTKYQMYNPKKTGCFKVGYYSSDPTANVLQNVGNPEDFINNPSSILNHFSLQIPQSASFPKTNQRNVGVVVWKKYSKCCW